LPNRVLTEKADELLTAARRVLADLRVELATVPATSDDAATLAESIRQLDELFLLVVVGEFNAGKSAFINALLGSRVLEEGVTPTTAQIHLIRYGATSGVEVIEGGIRQVTAPVDFLKDLHIVDTPGTNAILREHERLTTDFVPRADFVLFVTSADRPFTETERSFIEAIRAWGKKIVIVVNKIDIFAQEAELEQVVTFVGDAAQATLGTRTPIFPVSARLAARAKQGEPTVWGASRFEGFASTIIPRPALLRKRLEMTGKPEIIGPALRALLFGLVAVIGIQFLYLGSAFPLLGCRAYADITGALLMSLAPLMLAYIIVAALASLLAASPEA